MRARALLSLLLTLALSGPASSQPDGVSPAVAANGVLDLRGWDFSVQGTVSLNGEWLFYPGKLPADLADGTAIPEPISVPAHWTLREPQDAPGDFGFGTYQLTVRLPADAAGLGIRLKTVSSAYVLYANGIPIASAGNVGRSADDTQSRYQPQVAALPTVGDTLTLTMPISNFDHARGGLWDSVRLGPVESLQRERRSSLFIAVSLASAALMIGLYHLFIWLLRPRDLPALIFALLCASLALRIISVNEQLILLMLPDISYGALLRIEYLSLVALMGLAVQFLKFVVEDDLPSGYVIAIVAGCAAYGWLVLLTPVVVFTSYLFLIHLMTAVITVCATIATVRAIRRRVQGIWLYAASCIVLALVTAHDVAVSSFSREPLLDFGVGDNHLVAFGFLAVLFAQAVVLAIRSAGALNELQARQGELSAAKDALDGYARDLEARVLKRTAALKSANEKLEQLSRTDGLTGLSNRREFDAQLLRAWADHRRREAPMSLVMIDVDNFKGYNDHYGHGAGDDALIAIAAALAATVRRPPDLVARYGGEEIVALLPNTEAVGALTVAEHMRATVEELAIPHAHNVAPVVTISLGVATCVPPRAGEPDALLDAADQALYRAKDQGRNRVVAADHTAFD